MNYSLSRKINAFFKIYPRRTYNKGDLIITPDKPPEGIFCLTKGIVRCYALSKEGIELTINIYRPISFFPMLWVMNGKQDRYYYEALSRVKSYCAPRKNFENFIRIEHDVAYDLLKRIYRGLEGYMMRMESLLSGNAYFKTVTNILINALRFGKSGAPAQLRLTHKQIASQAGLTRETVTREIKKLQDKGIVSYQRSTLLIHDIHKLEQEIFE